MKQLVIINNESVFSDSSFFFCDNKSIKSIPESVDSTSFIIRWICDDCEMNVGIPNDEELNNYLR